MSITVNVKERLAGLIAKASEGTVTPDKVLGHQGELSKLGLTSLAQMRVVDAIENEFGVEFDLEREDLTYLDSLDGMVGELRQQGVGIDGQAG
jgi:acyl carrier protein